jgi:hypothetical protein
VLELEVIVKIEPENKYDTFDVDNRNYRRSMLEDANGNHNADAKKGELSGGILKCYEIMIIFGLKYFG